MIGTHNTLTYLNPIKWWFKPFRFLWRCQDKTLQEQINKGARYFDIRVRFNSDKNLIYCHGLVDLDKEVNIDKLISILVCNNCKCRIILERGENFDIMKVIPREYLGIIIDEVIIKKNWIILYKNDEINYKIIDYSYIPFLSNKSFLWNIIHIKLSTIKCWARKHNPINYSKSMIESNNIYFVDYF